MLYVEPVYVKSNQQNAYPLLQRVLIAYGDGGQYVTLANSLEEGVKELVRQGKEAGTGTQNPPPTGDGNNNPPPTAPPSDGTPSPTPELAAAAARVQNAIAEVKAAQASGDFARYGQALKALDDAMNEFQAVAQRVNPGAPAPGGSPAPTTSPAAGGGTASPSPSPGA